MAAFSFLDSLLNNKLVNSVLAPGEGIALVVTSLIYLLSNIPHEEVPASSSYLFRKTNQNDKQAQ